MVNLQKSLNAESCWLLLFSLKEGDSDCLRSALHTPSGPFRRSVEEGSQGPYCSASGQFCCVLVTEIKRENAVTVCLRYEWWSFKINITMSQYSQHHILHMAAHVLYMGWFWKNLSGLWNKVESALERLCIKKLIFDYQNQNWLKIKNQYCIVSYRFFFLSFLF